MHLANLVACDASGSVGKIEPLLGQGEQASLVSRGSRSKRQLQGLARVPPVVVLLRHGVDLPTPIGTLRASVRRKTQEPADRSSRRRRFGVTWAVQIDRSGW